MASEPVRIENYLHAADTDSTLDAVRALGALVEVRGDEVVVRGTGLREAREPDGPIDVGNAGTLLRLLPGLAGGAGGPLVHARRRRVDPPPPGRPDRRAAAPDGRRARGARAAASRRCTVRGARLRAISYELPVASAQVKSCVLLAALAADGATTRRRARAQPRPHRADAAARRRRASTATGATSRVVNADELLLDRVTRARRPELGGVPGRRRRARARLAPADRATSASTGRAPASCGSCGACGASCSATSRTRPASCSREEPVSDLDVAHGALEGTVVEADEVPLAIDELPLVALLGCFAEGETVVRGAQELRVKESDRIAGVVEGLRGLGADIEATEDGFAVRGTGGLRGGTIDAPATTAWR